MADEIENTTDVCVSVFPFKWSEVAEIAGLSAPA